MLRKKKWLKLQSEIIKLVDDTVVVNCEKVLDDGFESIAVQVTLPNNTHLKYAYYNTRYNTATKLVALDHDITYEYEFNEDEGIANWRVYFDVKELFYSDTYNCTKYFYRKEAQEWAEAFMKQVGLTSAAELQEFFVVFRIPGVESHYFVQK